MARILSLEEETIKKKQADPSTSSSTTTSTTAAAATASVTTASSNNHQLHPQGNMTSNSSSSVRLFSLGKLNPYYLVQISMMQCTMNFFVLKNGHLQIIIIALKIAAFGGTKNVHSAF